MIPATSQFAPIMERATSSAPVFRFGQFEADAARNTLARKGVRIKVQDQPFRVLLTLLEHPGKIVTREELRQTLWAEGTHVDFDGSLNVILKKLRTALDDDSDNPRFIETVPRHGYRFIAPVAVVETSPLNVGEGVTAADRTPNNRRRGRHFLIYATLAAAVVLLTVLAGYGRRHFLKARSPLSQSVSMQPIPVRKSVAVLGFRNMSGKVEDAWLDTALSEMLSTELANGEKLRLVSDEDVANLRLSSPWSQTDTLGQATASRLGAALNSDTLVLGSYTSLGKAGGSQLRVDVRLQDARTGEILTEIAETSSSEDFFHLTSRVGSRLRERLGVAGLEASDEAGVLASLPLDRDAARFYARGLAKLREFDALAAKDLLEQASAADPKFALVHAMLARAWHQLGYEQKRKEEAKKALDLSIDLPRSERMLVEGDYYESLAQHDKASSTYRALFELFPDSLDYGLLLATSQAAAGHGNQALDTLAKLRRLPPPASLDPRIDLVEAKTGQTKSDSLILLQSAMRKADSQGKKLLYAGARNDECMILVYGEHPERAMASCEDAYKIFLAAGNRLGAADAVRLIGDRQGYEGHFEQAVATYQKALHILEGLGEHEKTGALLNNLAGVLMNQGKLDRAEQLYRQAKSHFEQAGDQENTDTAIGNVADVLYLRGNLPAAEHLYQLDVKLEESRELGDPSYGLYRLADLELAQGRVADAHRMAQQAVEILRRAQSDYRDLPSALIVLGDVLKAEGDLQGARQQFQDALDLRKKMGEMTLLAECQVALAELALEESHPDQAESLLRPAIAEFEKDKANPDAASALVVLGRALLMEGKLDEAHTALRRASELSRTMSDPALKLPLAIETARIEVAGASPGVAGKGSLAAARRELRSTAAAAKKTGHFNLECESRLALIELELKANPGLGRSLLAGLADDARGHGLLLISRKATDLAAGTKRSMTTTH